MQVCSRERHTLTHYLDCSDGVIILHMSKCIKFYFVWSIVCQLYFSKVIFKKACVPVIVVGSRTSFLTSPYLSSLRGQTVTITINISQGGGTSGETLQRQPLGRHLVLPGKDFTSLRQGSLSRLPFIFRNQRACFLKLKCFNLLKCLYTQSQMREKMGTHRELQSDDTAPVALLSAQVQTACPTIEGHKKFKPSGLRVYPLHTHTHSCDKIHGL